MTSTLASYVLCGTPRSGSTLLCEMLAATGVAGRPNSYFRQEDMEAWADAWGVPRPQGIEGPGFDRDYLAALRREGSAGTGVFDLRLMWASVADAGRRLSRALDADRDLAASLEAAFGPVLYVHVSRTDKVAQAVSRVRAEQSGLWHRAADGSVLEGAAVPAPVSYDETRIAELVAELEADEAAWHAFFVGRGIRPLQLVYEKVATDPQAAVASILAALGLDPAAMTAAPVTTARLSDEESRRWIERFRQEQGASA
jgi:LPS sulfotransferase NodH